MQTVTLQLSFDSSYIDFNLEKQPKLLHKVSLLSVGNSYELNDLIPSKDEIKELANYLLPWKYSENDRPNILRAWQVKKTGETYEPTETIFDFKIKALPIVNEDDLNKIAEYYTTHLEEQISHKEDLELNVKDDSEIEIDENYAAADKPKVGKTHSMVSQMAQKLFPFNEALSFLYLSDEEDIDYDKLDQFYNAAQGIEFVFFPVSKSDNSIWFPASNKLKFAGSLAQLDYNIKSKLPNSDIQVRRVAFTVPTEMPEVGDYNSGNVQIRKDGKYVGEVKIDIEQDNDWKVNFGETLASLLDLRNSFIGFITPNEIQKYKNLTDNFVDNENPEIKIKEAIQYFLNPFIHIPDYLDSILEGYNNNAIADSGIQDINKLKIFRSELDKKTKIIKDNIGIFKSLVRDKKLVDVLELSVQFAKNKNGFELNLDNLCDYEAKSSESLKVDKLLAMLNQLNAISNEGDFSAVFFTILLKIVDFKDVDRISLDLANKSINAIKGEGINEVITPVPIESQKNINLNALWYSHILQNDKDANNVNLLTHLISKELKPFDFESISGEIIELHNKLTRTYSNLPVFVSKAAKIGFNDFIIKKLKEKYLDIQPTNDQAPIRIQIGKSEEIVPAVKDDLSDELSGYVLLSTRGVEINDDKNFKDWKHHNWAKAKINIFTEDPTSILKKETIPLESPFLIPAYLPIEKDTQKIFLEISNEKASLTAAIEGINQDVEELGDKKSTNLSYYLDKKPYDNPDNNHNPYGLLYGYHYNFAAFAILNSGVIPEVLRDDSTILNKFKESLGKISISGQKGYHYRRTKKIPAPGVKLNDVREYPKQLNPLYFELFPEKPGEEDKRCNKLIIVGEGFNSNFNITVEKPRTSFWDLYSFKHDGSNNLENNIKDYRLLKPKDKRFMDYIDPAVSDFLHVEIVEIHTLSGEILSKTDARIKYFDKAHDENNEELDLKGYSKEIKIELKPNAIATSIKEDIDLDKPALITLRPGTICSIKIYNLVEKKYFYLNKHIDCRFHECIDDFYDLGNAQLYNVGGVDYYKIAFDEHIIETALVEPIEQNKITPEELWNDLKINDKLPSVANFNEKNQSQNESSIKAIIEGNSEKYKLYSRVDVQHQKWEWNGRQVNIDVSKLMDKADPPKDLLNPSIKSDGIYSITEAMKFEAWAFSERPDYTATKTPARILASMENKDNIVHEYKNVIDNHCMYLRYALQIFNRYELLGEPYKNSIKGEIPIEKAQPKNKTNPWKRHLKLSKRTEALPTPAVRFYIPLTNSIEEANEVNDTADVMLVLDDVAYKEAGLAQKLTLGIRKTKDPNSEDVYPEAGYDPTLSSIKTTPLKINSEGDYLIVDDKYLKGPFGFTFDFNATNSKINSSSFIISGNGLCNYLPYDIKKDDPYWPMFNLSLRSEIIPVLHEFNFNEDLVDKLNKLKSEWSSSQWVQFMKAVDSFVPSKWREQVRKNGFVYAPEPFENIEPDLFNQFGPTFWQYHNWYLIFSTLESNIGGLPIESYYDTFIVKNEINHNISHLTSVHPRFEKSVDDVNTLIGNDIKNFTEGYVRIMVVRKSDDYDTTKTNEKIWEEIFGRDNNKIKEDNTLAIPILSERIPITIKK
jgi:hypothetical protein